MDTNWLVHLIVFLFYFLLALVGAIGTLTFIDRDTTDKCEAIANCITKSEAAFET